MPRKPTRACRCQGCTKLAVENSQYCEEHKKLEMQQYNRYRREYRSNERYGAKWRRIRKRYVKEHPLCEHCLEAGVIKPVQEVHHIVPLSLGGTNDESNLVSLCRSCHMKEHAKLGTRSQNKW